MFTPHFTRFFYRHRQTFPLFSLLLLNNAAHALGLGEETIPPGEAQQIIEVQNAVASLVAPLSATRELSRRPFHPKGHGCVSAQFTVRPDIPAALKVGVFAQAASYPAWIRFSNGAPGGVADNLPDTRGMAIKLIGVTGTKALSNDLTQDFVLANHPVFFLRNVQDFVEGGIPFFTDGTFPAGFEYDQNILKESVSIPGNLLTQTFWSQIPSLLGTGQAVKYKMKPCASNSNDSVSILDANRLTKSLKNSLAQHSQCFEFQLQRQINASTMPIEDPTIAWSETDSPFVTVANVDIPIQDPTTNHRNALCEQYSFNPWHTLTVQRPLGGIARARKAVYVAMANARRDHNGTPTNEPQPSPSLTDLTVTSSGGDHGGKFSNGQINYNVKVTNNSAVDAQQSLLTLVLPLETPLLNSLAGCNETATNIFQCDLSTLAAGTNVSFPITVTSSSATAKYTFVSRVSSTTEDSQLGNNQVSARYGGAFTSLMLIGLLGWRRTRKNY